MAITAEPHMSNPGDADGTRAASVQQLAAHIAAGCKPPAEYRIGTEHEKFGFLQSTARPPAYEPGGIRALHPRNDDAHASVSVTCGNTAS